MKWPDLIAQVFQVEIPVTLDTDDVHSILGDGNIRRVWIERIYDELRRINLEVDRLLERESSPNQFLALSARRKALLWMLAEIENSRISVELDSRPNYEEAEPRMAVQPAPGK